MTLNKELVKELENFDPDELVDLLGISTDQLIKAFPGHAYDYIRENLAVDDPEEEYRNNTADIDIIESLRNEGYTVLDEDS